jgi:hypothetical protein
MDNIIDFPVIDPKDGIFNDDDWDHLRDLMTWYEIELFIMEMVGRSDE